MPLYTVQIDGRDILVFYAESAEEADECMWDEEGFTQYVRATRSGGVPVMGANSQWSLNEPTPEQRVVWETEVNGLMLDRKDAEEQNHPVFLVAVDPPDSFSV